MTIFWEKSSEILIYKAEYSEIAEYSWMVRFSFYGLHIPSKLFRKCSGTQHFFLKLSLEKWGKNRQVRCSSFASQFVWWFLEAPAAAAAQQPTTATVLHWACKASGQRFVSARTPLDLPVYSWQLYFTWFSCYSHLSNWPDIYG